MGFKNTLAGFYKIESVKPDGTVKILADWFPNLILDQGLERIATAADWMNYCHVGSGSTAPAETQQGLVSFVGATNTYYSNVNGTSGSSPWYSYCTRVFQFAAGVADDILAEVGVGWSATGTTLFSRALILDSGGNNITITVLPDEVLRVTYEFRRYIPETDTTGTIVLDGITHTWVGRASSCSNSTSNYWPAIMRASFNYNYDYTNTYNGVLGPITGSPTGSSGTYTNTVAKETYIPGSYKQKWTWSFSLAQGNAVGGVSAIRFQLCNSAYQISFDPPIDKNVDNELSLSFEASWGRHTF